MLKKTRKMTMKTMASVISKSISSLAVTKAKTVTVMKNQSNLRLLTRLRANPNSMSRRNRKVNGVSSSSLIKIAKKAIYDQTGQILAPQETKCQQRNKPK